MPFENSVQRYGFLPEKGEIFSLIIRRLGWFWTEIEIGCEGISQRTIIA